jgi:hypothetical protein
MNNPSYAELAAHYKILLRAALAINDAFRREVDHAVFEGSSEAVDDLREAVNEKLHDWQDFLYGSDHA